MKRAVKTYHSNKIKRYFRYFTIFNEIAILQGKSVIWHQTINPLTPSFFKEIHTAFFFIIPFCFLFSKSFKTSSRIYLRTYNERLESEVAERTRELNETLEELKRVNEAVKKSYLDTIYRLSVAAEYKDEHTGSHIRKMSRIAALVAEEMGLPAPEVEAILYASPMHDIGKIGIPDRILLKPGKLNADEWEIMKQHTTIGATILSGSDSELLKIAETIALSHHERFDGTGYPLGLPGEEIPLPGKITAVADVFDALISKRPYKEAFPVGESLEIVRDGRNSHFDPEVLDAFFNVADRVLDIVKGSG